MTLTDQLSLKTNVFVTICDLLTPQTAAPRFSPARISASQLSIALCKKILSRVLVRPVLKAMLVSPALQICCLTLYIVLTLLGTLSLLISHLPPKNTVFGNLSLVLYLFCIYVPYQRSVLMYLFSLFPQFCFSSRGASRIIMIDMKNMFMSIVIM